MSDKSTDNKQTKELFEDFYSKVEGRIKELSDQVRDNIIPDTEEKLRKNVFTSIFVSFGVGFILGIVVMIFGFNSGRKK